MSEQANKQDTSMHSNDGNAYNREKRLDYEVK